MDIHNKSNSFPPLSLVKKQKRIDIEEISMSREELGRNEHTALAN